MTAADRRRDAVSRIIRTRRIATQEELLEALATAGFRATQATLSRDLARLGARRVSRPEGGTMYELSDGAPAGAEEMTTSAAAITRCLGYDMPLSLLAIRVPGSCLRFGVTFRSTAAALGTELPRKRSRFLRPRRRRRSRGWQRTPGPA